MFLICSNNSNYSPYWFSAPHFNRSSHASGVVGHWRGSMADIRSFSSSPLLAAPRCSHPAWMCPWQCNLLLWFRGHGKHHTTTVIFALKDLVPWPTSLPATLPAKPSSGGRVGGGLSSQKVEKAWFIVECVNLGVTAELVFLFRIAAGFGAKVGDLRCHLYCFFCSHLYPRRHLGKYLYILLFLRVKANKITARGHLPLIYKSSGFH